MGVFTLPGIPDELAEIIATHKTLFGGWYMEDPPPTAPADGAAAPSAGTEQPDDAVQKALAAAVKARDDALAQLQAIEDAGKTELQKAQDAATTAATDAAAAQAELARERIARRHNLSDADTELLTGDEKQMERIATRLAQTATPPGPKAPPVPGIGRVPETRNIPLADRIAAAEKDGNKALVSELKAMMLTTGQ